MSVLSVVIPAYNEEKNIENTIKEISAVLDHASINFEIIFVDDGSKDDTFKIIAKIAREKQNIRGISFSRNFGKESAIFAGLNEARGDCCVVIDCDMQHPPEVIPQMYQLWESGYQVVEGIKAHRGTESRIYSFLSTLFYKIMSKFSKLDMESSSDFKLLDKCVVEEIVSLSETHLFFRGLTYWIGFRSIQIEYSVAPRKVGKTKWSFFRLVKYAVNNISSFTSLPLQIITVIGGVFLLIALVLGIQTLVQYFSHSSLAGFTTVILLLLIIGGVIMISLGIIGHYLSKIYDEVKKRPRYIISQVTENQKRNKT